MTAAIGSVASLWRHPVKSMLGEIVAAAALDEHGIAGDRAYALVDQETGKVASVKHPRRWGVLFACRARFLEEPDPGSGAPPPAEIVLPDGSTTRTDDPAVHDALTRVTGRSVRLVSEPPPSPTIDEVELGSEDTPTDQLIGLGAPGTFFDGLPVHVVATSALTELGAASPGSRFDPRRFRANVVVETDDHEDTWLDRTLTVGEVALSVLMPTPRCIMTTVAQDDLPHDRDVLRTVATHRRVDIPGLGARPCVGVYAFVTTPGRIASGDAVTVA